jgi:hypothetical protein
MENRIFTVSLVYSFIFFRGQRSVVCGQIMQSINSLFFGLWSCTAVSGLPSAVSGLLLDS